MRQKKGIVSMIGLSLITVLLITGCHGSRKTDAFEVPEDFDETRQYEITFWAKNDTNKSQTAIYEKAIKDFEKMYPEITVNMRLYTDYGKIYNDVITNIATDTTPDVCITYPDHIATYLTGNNTVVPLDDLFSDRKYGFAGSELKYDAPAEDEVISKFLDECIINGEHYAIPFMRSTEACYVNKTYVEKLGFELPDTLTWDFVWKVSDAATRKDPDGNFAVNGQKVLIPFIYKSTDNMMIQMLKQKNAGYSDANGNILLFNDTTTDILKELAVHTGKGSFSTFKISGYPANFLDAGQCIFAVDSTAGATWMGSEAPLSDIADDKKVDFETAVMTVPQEDPSAPQMISQGPSICIFNKKDPQEVLASWLFAQYLLSDDVQTAYAETEGYIPVTSKAQSSGQYQDYLSHEGEDDSTHYAVKIQASKLLLSHVDDTFVTAVFNGSASLRDASGQLIENVTKSVRRKTVVDDKYIEKLYTDVTSLYHLDQINDDGSLKGSRESLGAMPSASVGLICSLAAAWLLIGISALRMYRHRNKN